MSTVHTYMGTLVVVECASCAMHFGVPKGMEEARRADHQTFYCPSGHTNYYPRPRVSRVKQLERQLENTEAEAASLRALRAALPLDIREADVRAKFYANAQRGAFWRGFSDRECGMNECPYPTTAFGFRAAWFDGAGREYEEPVETD